MSWVRSNLRHGSRLALFALAIQFVLSFGHFHAIAQAAPVAAAIQATGTLPASDHDSDRQANDPCAICAVVAMANTALFAAPPALPQLQSVTFRYLTVATAFVAVASTRVAFQPRAPPAS